MNTTYTILDDDSPTEPTPVPEVRQILKRASDRAIKVAEECRRKSSGDHAAVKP